jgi:bifunctional DNA-binding transcriptional regulator/antitoxin component of YhaV-PrlF toxin-antitoxin module
MSAERFTGTLEAGRGGGAAVAVPFDARAAFGEARAPVRGSVNGAPFRTRLMVYGGVTYLGLTKAVREAAGIVPGDAVEVVVERDDAPREVEVPPELAAALADPALRAAYDALAFTHRREYAEWVAEAKRPETRARRAAKAAERVRVSAGVVGGSNT